jgi:hypothetical protein
VHNDGKICFSTHAVASGYRYYHFILFLNWRFLSKKFFKQPLHLHYVTHGPDVPIGRFLTNE